MVWVYALGFARRTPLAGALAEQSVTHTRSESQYIYILNRENEKKAAKIIKKAEKYKKLVAIVPQYADNTKHKERATRTKKGKPK